MSTTSHRITINGTEYDFDRCTKEQLAAYTADLYRSHGAATSSHNSGCVVLYVARVPQESKADVARELAEYVEHRSKSPYADTFMVDLLYKFAERYRKAV